MSPALLSFLTMAAALACGLIGGLFFGFSNFIMRALGRLPTAHGVAAMQSINIVVINPLFLLSFFGAGGLCVVAAIAARSQPQFLPVVAAALLYVGGTLVVTMAGNVPLNNQLARVDPGSPEAVSVWRDYLSRWLFWNHIRTAAALLASAVLLWSLR